MERKGRMGAEEGSEEKEIPHSWLLFTLGCQSLEKPPKFRAPLWAGAAHPLREFPIWNLQRGSRGGLPRLFPGGGRGEQEGQAGLGELEPGWTLLAP